MSTEFVNTKLLKIGDEIDTWDKFNLWFPAKIVSIDEDYMTVTYPGWPTSYDEKIPLKSTDSKQPPRYTTFHTKTINSIHIEQKPPFHINFRQTTHPYTKLQFIATQDHIMMYGEKSLYQFNSIKDHYSDNQNKLSIDFDSSSKYQMLSLTDHSLHFIDFTKSICYIVNLNNTYTKNEEYKSININIPCFKSFSISTICNNEWYIIGQQYHELDTNQLDKHYDNHTQIDKYEAELNESRLCLRFLLNTDHNALELTQESYDNLLIIALQKRLKAIQHQIKKYEEMEEGDVNLSLKLMKIKYDIKKKSFIILMNQNIIHNKENKLFPIPYNKILYIATLHKLMVLDGCNIWTMDLCPIDYIFKWDLYVLKLPHKKDINERDWSYHLAFNTLLFVFYYMVNCSQEIWCLDLLTNEWFKCRLKYSPYCYKGEYPYTVVTRDNYLHSISVGGHKSHTKVWLNDLIPTQLYNLYYNHFYQISVIKFIKRFEEKYNVRIPMDISKLIMYFYPLLM